jgi:hypothetical protein
MECSGVSGAIGDVKDDTTFAASGPASTVAIYSFTVDEKGH